MDLKKKFQTQYQPLTGVRAATNKRRLNQLPYAFLQEIFVVFLFEFLLIIVCLRFKLKFFNLKHGVELYQL